MLRTATAVLFLLAQTAVAQKVDTTAIDKVMRDMMTTWKIPGSAIAVVKDDKVVFLKAYGVREIGGEPVTPDTLFQIASTSKAFTTTAMAMLVDEKKMKWDDPVRKHIDYFRLGDPCADSLVTLRDIVSHRTGLSGRDELWDYTTHSREDILRSLGSINLSRPFRSSYQYQNIMFMAAGETVAAASGMPYDDFIKTRIFEPLGMKNSVINEDEWLKSEHAVGYDHHPENDTLTLKPTRPYVNLGGGGLVKSSARDLSQWLRFQLANGEIDGKRLVSADVLQETKNPQMVIRQTDKLPETVMLAYGLGWRIQDYRGEELVWHSGSLNGFRTQVALLPRMNIGLAIVINAERGYGPAAAKNTLLDMFIGKGTRDWTAYFVAYDKKEDAEAAEARAKYAAKRIADTKPSRELSSYAGTYTSAGYGPATVTLENGTLVLNWNLLRVPLTHYHFDTFTAIDDSEDLFEDVTFSLGADGEVKKMNFFGEDFRKE